jgi:ADP-ribose pyrophosphatase YjhB (NUDIX family)
MKPGKLRVLALAVVLHKDCIFVGEGYDQVKRQTYYRPLGGEVEFGESSVVTVAREVGEESKAPIRVLRYMGGLENVFTYNGLPGHEVYLIHLCEFVEARMYQMLEVIAGHDEGAHRWKVRWMPLDSFRGVSAPPLYPDGLLAMIDALPRQRHKPTRRVARTDV